MVIMKEVNRTKWNERVCMFVLVVCAFTDANLQFWMHT